jgi:hypothetical protein
MTFVAQGGRFYLVGPSHADGGELQAGIGRAFTGTEDGCEHLIGRGRGGRVVGSDEVEIFLFHGGAVGVFTFEHDHLDRRRCHRHPEHDIQYNSSKDAGSESHGSGGGGSHEPIDYRAE